MIELHCDPVEIAAKARKDGPWRMIVDDLGLMVSYRTAREEYDTTWDFVLIRNDGWTLGTPELFSDTAYAQWASFWIGFIVEGDSRLYAMNDWDRRSHLLDEAHNSTFKKNYRYWVVQRDYPNGEWEVIPRLSRPSVCTVFAGYSDPEKATEKMNELNKTKGQL